MPAGGLVTAGLVSGGVALGGSVIKAIQEADAQKKAQAQREAILAKYSALELPDISKEAVDYTSPEFAGGYQTPEEQAVALQGTALSGISTDPRLRNAQMAALDKLSQLGSESLTPEEKAQLNTIRRDSAQQARSRQDAILQNMQARGMGGAGAELAAQLGASQASANKASEEGDRQAAMMHQRALQAIASSGALGGQIRGQEWGEKTDVARAQDAIAAFNAQQQAAVQSRNVANKITANRYNAEGMQSAANQRASNMNAQEAQNKALQGTNYNRQVAKLGMETGAMGGLASSTEAQASRDAAMAGQLASAGMSAAGTTAAAGIKGGGSSTSANSNNPPSFSNPTSSNELPEVGPDPKYRKTGF